MFITSWAPGFLPIPVIAGFFAISGCVSSGTYELVKKEAEDLKHELTRERVKREAIEKTYDERTEQMENLTNRLNVSDRRYETITKSWNDLRNQLTFLLVNRELERQKDLCGIGMVLEGDAPSTIPGK